MKVPFLDLRAQHAPLKAQILREWEAILDTAGFVGGQHVDGFEKEFAVACGVGHCALVSDGTAALRLALRALGVKVGDEVILPANTFIATAEGVSHVGGRPVLVDCDPRTFNIDPAMIEKAITDRTVGIVGVHLYGQPADFDALNKIATERNLWTMEDSAQGHLARNRGRTTGSLGKCASFSFYPGKNLGAPGEGGAVTSSNEQLIRTVRMLRDHGSSNKYVHEVIGENARLPSVMAAALRIKLPHLREWNEARRRHARRYAELLSACSLIRVPGVAAFAEPVWHLYVVHVPHRDRVRADMDKAGIGVGLHYPIPIHMQRAYSFLGHQAGDFPNAEFNAANGLSLPMYPELTDDMIRYVCGELIASVERAVKEAST